MKTKIPGRFTRGVEEKPDFGLIYRQYYKRIYNYVYGQFLHRETAEDLTDDVFLAALEHYGGYDPARGSVHTWLSAIAHNRVVNYRASAHTRREISVWVIPARPATDSGWQEHEEGTLEDPVNRRAYRILKKLTNEEREFLSLRYGLELTNGEIAQLTGSNAAAVSQKYHRLLVKCRQIDKEYGEGTE